jgi:predicted AAA+ superfamily ATPase
VNSILRNKHQNHTLPVTLAILINFNFGVHPMLNAQQQIAVTTPNASALILSGAGTGKSSVLVARISTSCNTVHRLNRLWLSHSPTKRRMKSSYV